MISTMRKMTTTTARTNRTLSLLPKIATANRIPRKPLQKQQYMQATATCTNKTILNPSSKISSSSLSCFSSFSTTTTTATTTAAQTTATKTERSSNTIGDMFLDNLGKIFLTLMGSVIAWLVRGSYNTRNRNAIRDRIELDSALDPLEIDDLRIANSDLTPDVFRQIMKQLFSDAGSNSNCIMTYKAFVEQVRTVMMSLKGSNFTIEFGHLLDRVVVDVLQHLEQEQGQGQQSPENNNKIISDHKMPLTFWFTILSLALNSTVKERMEVLYDILVLQQQQQQLFDAQEQYAITDISSTRTKTNIPMNHITHMIGYLQKSCQLVPDTQVVEIKGEKYPIQQHKRGTPEELLTQFQDIQEGDKTNDRDNNNKDATTVVDYDAFVELLNSRAVCAWGECYNRK